MDPSLWEGIRQPSYHWIRTMPIEFTLLDGQACKVTRCTKCHADPFEPFLRGQIQRWPYKFLFWIPRDYCALICSKCKKIIGYESPWILKQTILKRF